MNLLSPALGWNTLNMRGTGFLWKGRKFLPAYIKSFTKRHYSTWSS